LSAALKRKSKTAVDEKNETILRYSPAEIEKGFLWTVEEIVYRENIFIFVFEMFFEDKFLNKVYQGNQEIVSHAEFVKNFACSNNKQQYHPLQMDKSTSNCAPISWFFCAIKMNFVYRTYLSQPYKLEFFSLKQKECCDEDQFISLDGDDSSSIQSYLFSSFLSQPCS